MFICADVLDGLKKIPSNSVDAGVTSPPYNKQENKKGWLVNNVKYDSATDKRNEAHYQDEQVKVLNELYRVIKPGGSFFYNHKLRWEKGKLLHPLTWVAKSEWNLRQEIIWDRGIAANIRGWRFWQVEERIYWLYKSRKPEDLIGEELQSKHALCTSIWRIRPENKVKHPAPFPLALPTRCIYSVMNDKKGVIIDPYCGSGTTLVAAKLLGHKYIGIDISEQYLQQSKERVSNAYAEKDVFDKEIALHTVKETFSQKKQRGMHKNRLIKKESPSSGISTYF